MKNNNTKFEFKRRHIIYIIVGAILVSIVGAIIINEAYKVGTGYQTKWQASDMLIFFATIIEAIGTISLGAISIWQNVQLNKSNEKAQERLEEINIKSNEINLINKIVERENNRIENLIAVSKEFEDLLLHAFNMETFKNTNNATAEESKVLLDRIKLHSLHSQMNYLIGIDLLNLKEALNLAKTCDEVTKCTDAVYDDRINKELEKYKTDTDSLIKKMTKFFKETNNYILDTQMGINDILLGDTSLDDLREALNKCMEEFVNGQAENAE